jgi:hypothetical protein
VNPAEQLSEKPKSDPIRDEIEQLRAKREALAAARLARAEAAAPDEKLAAERLALADEEAMDQAEAEHGKRRVALVQTDLGAVIVKRPHPAIFKRFQDRGKTNTDALADLIRPCLLHPTLTGFERICEELPATLTRVADAITVLAGFRSDDISGKS